MKKHYTAAICLLISACSLQKKTGEKPQAYQEEHRPQFHFSPKAQWMNDPNGLIYVDGTYHLFFQHYPESNVWGPMHWGHASSEDLIHWQEQAIALYPDSLGWIFSGSAVYDKENTSGLGTEGNGPLVAIFTHHNANIQQQGRKDFEYQSLAFSLDKGKTWKKYAGNPVLNNPGIRDFRDPKVHWNEQVKKWILTLATQDRVTFYSSPNLISWTKESDFGANVGAHESVWECPDLFPLEYQGQTKWVLLVSVGNGAPNGGSGTQYFIGDFDGKKFTADKPSSKWLEQGKDNYAGVTFANTKKRTFLGWMSNLQYAQKVPTEVWRSAMTFPRELVLKSSGGDLFLASRPVEQISKIRGKEKNRRQITIKNTLDLSDQVKNYNGQLQLQLYTEQIEDYQIILSNDAGEEVIIGFNEQSNQHFIDRSKAGKTGFDGGFATKIVAPRLSESASSDLNLLIDVSSIELFADDGLTTMTTIMFPHKPYDKLEIRSENGITLQSLKLSSLKSIWNGKQAKGNR